MGWWLWVVVVVVLVAVLAGSAVRVQARRRRGGVIAAGRARSGRHAVRHGEVPGKRLLTDLGDGIGQVTDAEFDPEPGALLSLPVSGGPAGQEELDAGAMTGVGSSALVLRAV